MSLPASLVEEVPTAKAAADSGSPALDQLAFADLLTRGDYVRHVARVRQLYRQRRDRLMAALRRRLPQLVVEGAAAGLHVLLRLADRDDVDVAAAASERGVGVRAMSGLSLVDPPARGLVLGYGRLPRERIDDAVAELAAVIAAGPSAGPAAADALRAGH